MRTLPIAPFYALLALSVGFAAMSLGFVAGLFDALALALAAASDEGLTTLGYRIARNGAELRDLVAGFAVEVTEVCDGHGVIISWAAILLALGRGWRVWLTGLVIGVAVIQVFNLLRVMVLFAVVPAGSAMFDLVHYYVFPLLTALLLMGLGYWRLEGVRRRMGRALIISAGLAIPWFFAADFVAGLVLPPLANGLLALFGPVEVDLIANRAAGWTVGAHLVAAMDPLRLHLAPILPSDFTLALPVLLGAALAVGRGGWLLLAAFAGMAFAMALGAVTAVWGVAEAQGAVLAVTPAGPGQVRVVDYFGPSPLARGVVALVQNVLVHLNLLVLPVLLLGRAVRGENAG